MKGLVPRYCDSSVPALTPEYSVRIRTSSGAERRMLEALEIQRARAAQQQGGRHGQAAARLRTNSATIAAVQVKSPPPSPRR